MAYLLGIDPLAAWTTAPEFQLGTLAMTRTPQGTKIWKYVKLRNETATVAVAGTSSSGQPNEGDMLAYLAAPANNDEINTVVSDYTDAEAVPVGAGMAFVSIAGVLATAYYGWIQTTGYAISRAAIGGVGDNKTLICSATDLTLTLSTALTDPVCAICIVDATKNLRLCCPL